MIVSLVVAVAENGAIGKNNQMPWHLPDDLRFFKSLTTGHSIIMGRKTFESLGKPLKNRKNIVISRNKDLSLDGAEIFDSLESALRACEGENEVFVIGGGGIYEYALSHDLVDRIYLTDVEGKFEADTWFKIPRIEEWEVVSSRRHDKDEKHPYAFVIRTLERIRG